ncbi:MAG: Zn-ribbon domain-containing OB-fold protein [Alphaproteobacteria bacterium]
MTSIDQSKFEGPGPDAVYQDFLGQGAFKIQKCNACGKFQFFPRQLCSHCGALDTVWRDAAGTGEIYSVSLINRRAEKGGPFNVVIVDLAEGPRMMSRVENIANEDIKIGMPVKARIVDEGGSPIIVFDPA